MDYLKIFVVASLAVNSRYILEWGRKKLIRVAIKSGLVSIEKEKQEFGKILQSLIGTIEMCSRDTKYNLTGWSEKFCKDSDMFEQTIEEIIIKHHTKATKLDPYLGFLLQIWSFALIQYTFNTQKHCKEESDVESTFTEDIMKADGNKDKIKEIMEKMLQSKKSF